MAEQIRHTKKGGHDHSKAPETSVGDSRPDHKHLDAQTGHKNEGPLDGLNRDDFDRDLRPHENDGQNRGSLNVRAVSAYDFKDLHEKLPQLSSAELRNLLVLPTGTRLQQGARYLDLTALSRGELVATADMVVVEGHRYVAKTEVDYELWDKLRGFAARIS